ncbi:MAG: sulfatase family protein [Anaerolineae bacterium]
MPRPNVLLLFTDQQRHDTIHAAGNPVIATPHLDRLTREGVRFSSAYTPSPVCVPARCSLLYGLYPHHTGCSDNDDPMPADRPSLMQALSEAGYRTHGIGKMHFTPDLHALRGYRSRETQEEILGPGEPDDYLAYLHANGFEHVHDPFGCRGEMYYVPQPAQMPARLHGSQWVGDRSVAFLESQPAHEPFFLMSSFIHPHPPFTPPTPWNKLYRGPLMPPPKRPEGFEAFHTYVARVQNRYKYRDAGFDLNLVRMLKAYYYACISFVDFQIGRILAALERSGCLDNTLILFASDHGECLGDYGCFGKRNMLDVAARIPLLARLPGRFAAGATCDTPASLVDVMPTILAAAGIPANDLALDGVDLATLAREPGDRTVFSQYNRAAQGVYMAVDSRRKYFYSAPDRREFLLDRVRDPEETRNRAGVTFCRTDLARMRATLIGTLQDAGYEAPIADGAWRLYPQPELPVDPDAGLLVQDQGWAAPYQWIPGYSEAPEPGDA